MHKFIQNLAKFGELGEVTDLLGSHLVEAFPVELFLLFQSPQHILRDAFKLPERVEARPHCPVDHFGEFECPLGH